MREKKTHNSGKGMSAPGKAWLGFYYILPYYEWAADSHKGTERHREREQTEEGEEGGLGPSVSNKR